MIRDHRKYRWYTARVVDALLVGFWRMPGLSYVAHVWTNRVDRWDHGTSTLVLTVPLTFDQAHALHPEFARNVARCDGVDEDGDVWEEGRYVAWVCPECGARAEAEGRLPRVVQDTHEAACPGPQEPQS